MEINANTNSGALNGLPASKGSANTAKSVTGSDFVESDSFASSTALEGALNDIPDIRPEAVANGRDLIGNANYPSGDTIQRLSNFLANQVQASVE